jgi:hypothetical protein
LYNLEPGTYNLKLITSDRGFTNRYVLFLS